MVKLILEHLINRICKICGSRKTSAWHKDKYWGKPRLGLFCHNCFTAIKQRENRGIVNKRKL